MSALAAMRTPCAQWSTHHWASALRMLMEDRCWGGFEDVPWCNGYFTSAGVELWGDHAADESINVGGRDLVFGSLGRRRPCWDSSGFPVAFVGGKGLECICDDVLHLPLRDDVVLHARISG